MSNPVARLEVDTNPTQAVAQFPNPFPKNAFFLTDSDFDETWPKASYGSIIQKPFIQKLWQPVRMYPRGRKLPYCRYPESQVILKHKWDLTV